MNYEEFVSDLSPRRTIMFAAAEEQEEMLRRQGINQKTRQLGIGKFRFDLAARSAEQVDLFSGRFKKAVSITLEPAMGKVRLLFPVSANGQYSASGENVANDKLLVIPSGSGTDIVTPDLAGAEAIIVSESRFIEMTEALCPTFVRPEGMAVIEGNVAQLHALRKAVLSVVADPDVEPHHGQVSNILAATIAWIGDTSRQHSPIEISECMRRVHIAKIAQDYIESHYQDAVHIEDLCRACAVGVRTLQRYFREYFDLPVSQYLKTVRLDSARRELVTANSSETSVTNIAMTHGCTHLGRFSVEFRERFGVSPQDVLNSRHGQK